MIERFKEFLKWLGPFQISVLAILGFLFVYAKIVGYIGFNTDVSLPYKLFYVNKLDKGPFKQGDIIAFEFWGSDYYPQGFKMVKMVRCTPGSRLEVINRDFYCDGVYLGHAKGRDRYGKEVYNYYYNDVIPEGYYFVMGTHPDSYDSRYYGLVWSGYIIGKAYPLF